MCGIAGYVSLGKHIDNQEEIARSFKEKLHKRGPDSSDSYINEYTVLTHTRLSLFDVSDRGVQPMYSKNKDIVLVFNGEIFNFKQLRRELEQKGHVFYSDTDTEVILNMYIEYGIEAVQRLNGFFAFAIYDSKIQTTYIVRDRFGVKPLVFFHNEEKLIFASELKALMSVCAPLKIDFASLQLYLRLTYLPPPYTIFEGVSKLVPGHYLKIENGICTDICYYELKYEKSSLSIHDYPSTQKKLFNLFTEVIDDHIVSDVPVGCFLSGGIDSSIVTALASKHIDGIQTYSLGFKDSPYYDETKYAEIVAKMHSTNHTSFMLSTKDLYDSVFDMLDYIDEPFADSSALAMYVLSRETKKDVTIALSGDGADEVFGGYNKYLAEYNIQNKSALFKSLIKHTSFVWNTLPQSRSTYITDLFRKINKYSKTLRLSAKDRYWYLSTFTSSNIVNNLLATSKGHKEYMEIKTNLLALINDKSDLNKMMLSDVSMVLSGDMVHKVDLMSMSNSLVVRPPFLDQRVMEFAFQLPVSFKIGNSTNKKILRDTFGDLLPKEILNRGKHGFEVPMNSWFKNEMKQYITDELFSESFIVSQGIFNFNEVKKLMQIVFNNKYHDYQALFWSLIVFQYWYKKYSLNIL